MQIKKQLVSQNVVNQRSYGIGNPKKYITIHQTGNKNKGANAQAHANIQSRLNPRQASWHYTVDDKEVFQSFDDDVKCWHSGDGRGPGNTQSIGIEICINEDGNYQKAIKNAAKLVQHLMNKYDIPVSNIKQHYDWSQKNCPAQLRANYKGISWNDFMDLVREEESQDIHVVVKGDTLWGIANKHNTTVLALKQLNGLKGDLIRPGDKIKVPGSKEVIKKEMLHLPKNVASWRVYPLDKAPVKGNEIAFLNPKKFGGLQYEVLDKPQAHVVTIKTKNFGVVNIYVHPSTGAIIKK